MTNVAEVLLAPAQRTPDAIAERDPAAYPKAAEVKAVRGYRTAA